MTSRHHILVVDDDEGVRVTLVAYLKAEGFRHSEAANVAAAERILAGGGIDLVLLDVRMPGEDGISFIRRLRKSNMVPVILVSGVGEDVDRILGLEMGADDYVAKPFNRRELLARIRAVLRRTEFAGQAPAKGDSRGFEGWVLDLAKRGLTSPDGAEVPLTRGEFDLLAAFVENPGRVLSRDRILDMTSRRDEPAYDRTVDVMVRRLRAKMEEDPSHPRFFITVHGVGYLFAPDVEAGPGL